MARNINIVAALAVSALCAGSAMAQTRASQADRLAYDAALKCYVANTVAASGREAVGDSAGVERYRVNANRAFDGAMALGRSMGMSNVQLNRDLDSVEARELSRMVPDAAYFRQTVAACKAVGLM